MDKRNCQAECVPFRSYARIPEGIRFTNCAACQTVTPESIRKSLPQMEFLQVLLTDAPLEDRKAAA